MGQGASYASTLSLQGTSKSHPKGPQCTPDYQRLFLLTCMDFALMLPLRILYSVPYITCSRTQVPGDIVPNEYLNKSRNRRKPKRVDMRDYNLRLVVDVERSEAVGWMDRETER